MKVVYNNYVRSTMLLVLILVAVSISPIGEEIIRVTGDVINSENDPGITLDCDFEDTFMCKGGETPSLTEGVDFVEGKVGRGIFMDSGDVLEYLTKDNYKSAVGTVEFWAKPNWDSSSIGAHRFFYTRSTGWDFYIGTEKFNYFLYFHVKYANAKHKINTWNPNEWHLFTATWNRLETRLYVDGVLKAREKYYAPSVEPDRLYIGSENIQTNQADAVIDELKIYDYVRTSSQIKNHYDLSLVDLSIVVEEPEPLLDPVDEDIPEPILEPIPDPFIEPDQINVPVYSENLILYIIIGVLILVVAILAIRINKH